MHIGSAFFLLLIQMAMFHSCDLPGSQSFITFIAKVVCLADYVAHPRKLATKAV